MGQILDRLDVHMCILYNVPRQRRNRIIYQYFAMQSEAAALNLLHSFIFLEKNGTSGI